MPKKFDMESFDRAETAIARLSLETTDMRPMKLFVEREQFSKRAKVWLTSGIVAGFFTGMLIFFFVLFNNEYGFLLSVGAGAVVFLGIFKLAQIDAEFRMRDWTVRAQELIADMAEAAPPE